MESAPTECVLAAYRDVLRAIVALVRPPRAIHEEKLLAAILLAVMFGVALTALWFGAWQYPFTLASMIVGSTLILLAAVMARGRK